MKTRIIGIALATLSLGALGLSVSTAAVADSTIQDSVRITSVVLDNRDM
ncbi:hypothetical protein [Antribacter gilvus]|nr:hypothetical protein [Antribacter gilvus]